MWKLSSKTNAEAVITIPNRATLMAAKTLAPKIDNCFSYKCFSDNVVPQMHNADSGLSKTCAHESISFEIQSL